MSDEEILQAIVERSLPVVINTGRYVGVCDCGNPLAGARCRCPVPYVELRTWEAFRDHYDAASPYAQERLWSWILDQCDKHGPEVLAGV